ncbi:MAG: sucrase ferredoxin [Gaiellaceae bacterium]
MTADSGPFCAEISGESGEPLGATASRVDHWLLVEYRGLWSHDALAGSGLSDQVKAHLREQAAALPRSKLLLVRRRERRGAAGIAVFSCRSSERDPLLHGLEVEGYDDLRGVDFTESAPPGRPLGHPLFLVCTHGKHDRCCARYGRPLHDALSELAEPGWVWQSTHVGGDRFAGNVVVLPEGLYFGRVGAGDALALLEDHLERRLDLERFRGRSCYPFAVQAADLAVRSATGLAGLDDLALESIERAGAGWRVRFSARSVSYETDVVRRDGELTRLTCSAPGLSHPRHYAAESPPERAS